jgi:hypothetical protein
MGLVTTPHYDGTPPAWDVFPAEIKTLALNRLRIEFLNGTLTAAQRASPPGNLIFRNYVTRPISGQRIEPHRP